MQRREISGTQPGIAHPEGRAGALSYRASSDTDPHRYYQPKNLALKYVYLVVILYQKSNQCLKEV